MNTKTYNNWAEVIAERKGRKAQPTVSQYVFDRERAEADGRLPEIREIKHHQH